MTKCKLASAAIAAAAALNCAAVDNPFIGINFIGGNANGAPTSLLPTDTAGLIPQANFNNVAGEGSTTNPLLDANGVATVVTLTFAGGGSWGTGTGTGTGDQKLFNGYLDGTENGTNTFTLNNVPAGTYKLIIYSQPDALDGRDEHFILNGNPATTTYLSAEGGASLNSNGFVRATATTLNGAGAVGNYVEYNDIVLASPGPISFTSTSDNFRNFENGLQLVSVTVPEPTSLGLVGAGVLGLLRRRSRA